MVKLFGFAGLDCVKSKLNQNEFGLACDGSVAAEKKSYRLIKRKPVYFFKILNHWNNAQKEEKKNSIFIWIND